LCCVRVRVHVRVPGLCMCVSILAILKLLPLFQDLVLKFEILRKLEKHRGCVNTVSFNESGDILLSGSDDRRVILWDWEIGRVKLSFHSGHGNNVFQAKFMPYSDDRSIVTCAADGQVIFQPTLTQDRKR